MMRLFCVFFLMYGTACGELQSFQDSPVFGDWSLQAEPLYQNDCDFLNPPNGSGLFEMPTRVVIDQDDEGEISLGVEGGGQWGVCSLIGASLECKPAVIWARLDDGVTMSMALSVGGEFLTSSLLEGDYTLEHRCNGAGCSQHETLYGLGVLPCQQHGELRATSAM